MKIFVAIKGTYRQILFVKDLVDGFARVPHEWQDRAFPDQISLMKACDAVPLKQHYNTIQSLYKQGGYFHVGGAHWEEFYYYLGYSLWQ